MIMSSGIFEMPASGHSRGIKRRVKIVLGQFKGLWPFPLSGLELTADGFGDRGERLKAEGKHRSILAFQSSDVHRLL